MMDEIFCRCHGGDMVRDALIHGAWHGWIAQTAARRVISVRRVCIVHAYQKGKVLR